NPEYVGDNPEMIIAQDPQHLIRILCQKVIQLYGEKEIPAKYLLAYANVLAQGVDEDNDQQAELRGHLESYQRDGKLENLKTLTEKTLYPDNNTLVLRSGNALVEGAQIWIDGYDTGKKMPATGETVKIDRLGQGEHSLTVESTQIARKEERIEFPGKEGLKQLELAGEKARATITIQSEPSGATVTINGKEQETITPVEYESVVGETIRIQVHKIGYNEAQTEITLEDKNKSYGTTLTLAKNAAPNAPKKRRPGEQGEGSTVKLEWECEDPENDAIRYEVWIQENGEWTQKAREIEENAYELTGLEYGTEYRWKVVARDSQGNETEGVTWSFCTPEAPRERVRIVSKPEGANIEIDGEKEGNAPIEVELEEGTYRIEANLSGYYERKETIRIEKREGTGTEKSLEREKVVVIELEAKPGKVVITTSPSGASIYINGNYKGTSGYTYEGPAGEIQVKVEAEKYESEERTIKVERGEEKEIEIKLQRNEAPEKPRRRADVEGNQVEWKSEDPEGDRLEYDVWLKGEGEWEQIATGQTENRYTFEGIEGGKEYQWKVVVRDDHGNQTESIAWTIQIPTPLEPPVNGMVLVKAGRFEMGNSEGYGDEKPVHRVELTYDYLIGKYEVTFAEYDAYCAATGASKPSDRGWGRGSRPVMNV
ncbi:MAG TPA: PEGA domain-containing protein, partial [Thermotogota bacterium]|nr:PEGA domain-containing protein [Thermotogota bacterium]